MWFLHSGNPPTKSKMNICSAMFFWHEMKQLVSVLCKIKKHYLPLSHLWISLCYVVLILEFQRKTITLLTEIKLLLQERKNSTINDDSAGMSTTNPKIDITLLTTLEEFHDQEKNLQSSENYRSLVRNQLPLYYVILCFPYYVFWTLESY